MISYKKIFRNLPFLFYVRFHDVTNSLIGLSLYQNNIYNNRRKSMKNMLINRTERCTIKRKIGLQSISFIENKYSKIKQLTFLRPFPFDT